MGIEKATDDELMAKVDYDRFHKLAFAIYGVTVPAATPVKKGRK